MDSDNKRKKRKESEQKRQVFLPQKSPIRRLLVGYWELFSPEDLIGNSLVSQSK